MCCLMQTITLKQVILNQMLFHMLRWHLMNPVFFFFGEPTSTVFPCAAASPEASLASLFCPERWSRRSDWHPSTDHSHEAPCPELLVPLTSSTGCRPQTGNYLLSEPWSPSLRAQQELGYDWAPSQPTGASHHLPNNDSCSCRSGWATPSIFLSVGQHQLRDRNLGTEKRENYRLQGTSTRRFQINAQPQQ